MGGDGDQTRVSETVPMGFFFKRATFILFQFGEICSEHVLFLIGSVRFQERWQLLVVFFVKNYDRQHPFLLQKLRSSAQADAEGCDSDKHQSSLPRFLRDCAKSRLQVTQSLVHVRRSGGELRHVQGNFLTPVLWKILSVNGLLSQQLDFYFTKWCFLFQSCKAVYDRIIDLKIATPQIVMNYGMFLEENNYFEEAFKVELVPEIIFLG